MADFILGRLKFTFIGAWAPDYNYIKDDIVRVGGRSYVCMENHTSGLVFETEASKWEIISDGTRWRNAWAQNTRYEINDIVNFESALYLCNTAHTSTLLFSDNNTKFDTYFDLSGILDAGLVP